MEVVHKNESSDYARKTIEIQHWILIVGRGWGKGDGGGAVPDSIGFR